jgi:serine/threonine-protein kinase
MVGRSFGKYRALSLLGEGGMGTVYLAEHVEIGLRVAVKVLHSEFTADLELPGRFLEEARAANAIRHPNIVEVLDWGKLSDGVPYLVLELLEGESLAARLKRTGRVPLPEALAFAYQAASALGAGHEKAIIHRDLKPGNLFAVLDANEGDHEHVKILDLGTSKLQRRRPGDSVERHTGTLMETAIYMSPEQCRGKPVDHRSNIYSLGLILHELIAGRPPFLGNEFSELVKMHVNVRPPSLAEHGATVRQGLEALVLRALAKNPEDRFQSMDELQEGLKALGGREFVLLGSSPTTSSVTAPRTGPPPVPEEARATAKPAARVIDKQDKQQEQEKKEKKERKEKKKKEKEKEREERERERERERDQRERERQKRTVPAADQEGRRRPLAVAGIAAGVAALGLVVFLVRGAIKGGKDGAEPRSGPMIEPLGQAAAQAPVPSSAPSAKVEMVNLTIESKPPGARVVFADGALFGITPLSVTRRRGPGSLEVRLEKHGYTPVEQTIPLDRDSSMFVALEKRWRSLRPTKKAEEPASEAQEGGE